MDKYILSTGYFSLGSVHKALVDKGYKILSFLYHDHMSGDGMEGIEYVHDHEEEIMIAAHNNLDKRYNDIMGKYGEYYFGLASIGGAPLVSVPDLGYVLRTELQKDLSTVLLYEEVAKYLVSKYNICGIITHLGNSKKVGPVMDISEENGIPSFCIHNGVPTNGALWYCSDHTFEKRQAFQYLHGQWWVDFINSRPFYDDVQYKVTGYPHFDLYYGKEKKRDDNVFLYSSSVVYSTYTFEPLGATVRFHKCAYPWLRRTIHLGNDINFFLAFAKYQQINPKAKLVISQRPYFGMSPEDHKIFVEHHGIKNVKIYNFRDRPLHELLKECGYFISIMSTAIVEGIINRVPTVLLTGTVGEFCNYFNDEGSILKTTNSVEEIIETLVKVSDPKVKEELVKKCDHKASYYNYMDDGKATERVVEDIIDKIER